MSLYSAPNLAHIHHGETLSEAHEETNCQLLSSLGRCTESGLNVFRALEEIDSGMLSLADLLLTVYPRKFESIINGDILFAKQYKAMETDGQ